MSIITDSLSSITPTVTLAEMYEEQQHYAAAYLIFRWLALKNPSDSEIYHDHLGRISTKINGDDVALTKVDGIFSKSEALRLGIITSSFYSLLEETVGELTKIEATELDDFDIEEPSRFSNIKKKFDTEWQEIMNSDNMKQNLFRLFDKSDIKLGDFIDYFNKQNIQDLPKETKLTDIIENFLEDYSKTK